MAEFKFGFEESWFRLIIKKLPENPDLFSTKADAVQNAQSLLRIGKLKVGAARVWAIAAGIIKKSKNDYILSDLGKTIAEFDPQMEEDGIWWLIHYNLARQKSTAWFYAYYFNIFEHIEFSRSEVESELRNYWFETNGKPMTDSVFDKLIYSPLIQVFNGTRLGTDFGLFIPSEKDRFSRNPAGNQNLPHAVFCYALMDWAKQNKRESAHIDILLEPWSPGKIFRLDRESLDMMLMEIGERYHKKIAWISHTANLNSVSLQKIPPLTMLMTYYLELDGLEPHEALDIALKRTAGK